MEDTMMNDMGGMDDMGMGGMDGGMGFEMDMSMGGMSMGVDMSIDMGAMEGFGSYPDRKQLDGTLTLNVIRANDLFNADNAGKSDPYVAVYIDYMEETRTTVRLDNLNPVWNERFSFKLRGTYESIRLQVLDQSDHTINGQVIGVVDIPLADLNGQHHEVTFPLQAAPGTTALVKGTLTMSFVYLDLNSALEKEKQEREAQRQKLEAKKKALEEARAKAKAAKIAAKKAKAEKENQEAKKAKAELRKVQAELAKARAIIQQQRAQIKSMQEQVKHSDKLRINYGDKVTIKCSHGGYLGLQGDKWASVDHPQEWYVEAAVPGEQEGILLYGYSFVLKHADSGKYINTRQKADSSTVGDFNGFAYIALRVYNANKYNDPAYFKEGHRPSFWICFDHAGTMLGLDKGYLGASPSQQKRGFLLVKSGVEKRAPQPQRMPSVSDTYSAVVERNRIKYGSKITIKCQRGGWLGIKDGVPTTVQWAEEWYVHPYDGKIQAGALLYNMAIVLQHVKTGLFVNTRDDSLSETGDRCGLSHTMLCPYNPHKDWDQSLIRQKHLPQHWVTLGFKQASLGLDKGRLSSWAGQTLRGFLFLKSPCGVEYGDPVAVRTQNGQWLSIKNEDSKRVSTSQWPDLWIVEAVDTKIQSGVLLYGYTYYLKHVRTGKYLNSLSTKPDLVCWPGERGGYSGIVLVAYRPGKEMCQDLFKKEIHPSHWTAFGHIDQDHGYDRGFLTLEKGQRLRGFQFKQDPYILEQAEKYMGQNPSVQQNQPNYDTTSSSSSDEN